MTHDNDDDIYKYNSQLEFGKISINRLHMAIKITFRNIDIWSLQQKEKEKLYLIFYLSTMLFVRLKLALAQTNDEQP